MKKVVDTQKLADPDPIAQTSEIRRSVVEFIDVSKSYGGGLSLALHPTSFRILEGEFFSVLGPSGSGKTTILRLIGGFEAASTGRVHLGGVDVTDRPANLRDVNTVFQNYALFPHLSVAENIAYPLRAKRVDAADCRRRMQHAVEMVELTGYERRLPHELSGGQRQRVALGRALIGRPKVLLLDEPLGALDLRLRQQMQSVLTQLQRELGITFVYVTHDHGEALAMSDRIAVMTNGQISQMGTPQDIYYRPSNRFVAGFIGNTNIIDGVVDASGRVFRAGQCRLALPKRCSPGPLSLAVRAENVAIAPGAAPADCSDRLGAIVQEVVFLGEVIETRVLVGLEPLISRQPAKTAAGPGVGSSVSVFIDPAAIVPLDD